MRLLGKLVVFGLAAVGAAVLVVVLLGYFLVRMLDFDALKDAFQAESMPNSGYLAMTLDRPFPEKASKLAFLSRALSRDAHLELRQVVETLDRAAADPRVLGLAVRLSPSRRGLAQTQELRDAFRRFQASGKPAVVFSADLGGEGPSSSNLYLASAFEEFWLQPSGTIDFSGYAFEVPFYRTALSRLGISFEHSARKEYKTAADSLVRDAMSPAQRESLQALLSSLRTMVVADVAKDRGLSFQAVNALLGRVPMSAEEAMASGLVAHVGYWDEALASLTTRAGTSEAIAFGDYAALKPTPPEDAVRIAYVQAVGMIEGKKGSSFDDEGVESEALAAALSEAIDDPDVAAIVLRIDSPGGSYAASDTIWREVRRAHESNRPLVVSMGDVAASGGYFIAAPAARIVAQPGTLTGSIGVLAMRPTTEALWNKLDVAWETVREGENAALWSPIHPFTPEQRQWFEKMLDDTYADFVARVVEGRGLGQDRVESVAGGRVWLGQDAMAHGLIDELGGFGEAVRAAKRAAGLDEDAPYILTTFPKTKSGLDWIKLVELLESGELGAAVSSFVRLSAQMERVAGPALELLERQSRISSKPALTSPLEPKDLR